MKNFKVKTIVIKDFNDSQNGGKAYEKNEEITLERTRYEELLAKGYVAVGNKINEDKKQEEEE